MVNQLLIFPFDASLKRCKNPDESEKMSYRKEVFCYPEQGEECEYGVS